MPNHRADQAEGDGDHHDNGLHVGSEHQGKQSKDCKERDANGLTKGGGGIALLALLTAEIDDQARVRLTQRRQDILFDDGIGFLRCDGRNIHIGRYSGDLAPVAALNRRGCQAFFDLRHNRERDCLTIGSCDHEVQKIIEAVPLILREAHPDLDIVSTALKRRGLKPKESRAGLCRQIVDGHTVDPSLILQGQPVFGPPR